MKETLADLVGVDAVLDAVALVEAKLRRDVHAANNVVDANDDVEHWKDVATALMYVLGEALERVATGEEQREFLDSIRRQAEADEARQIANRSQARAEEGS